MNRKKKLHAINDFSLGIIPGERAQIKQAKVEYHKMTLPELLRLLNNYRRLSAEDCEKPMEETWPPEEVKFLNELLLDLPHRRCKEDFRGVDIVHYYDKEKARKIHSAFYYPRIGKMKQVWVFNMPDIDYGVTLYHEVGIIERILWRESIGESKPGDQKRMKVILDEWDSRSGISESYYGNKMHATIIYKNGNEKNASQYYSGSEKD